MVRQKKLELKSMHRKGHVSIQAFQTMLLLFFLRGWGSFSTGSIEPSKGFYQTHPKVLSNPQLTYTHFPRMPETQCFWWPFAAFWHDMTRGNENTTLDPSRPYSIAGEIRVLRSHFSNRSNSAMFDRKRLCLCTVDRSSNVFILNVSRFR